MVSNARNAAPTVPGDEATGSDANMADWIDVEEPLFGPLPPSPPSPPLVSEVKCLYPTHIQHVTVSTCGCKPVAVLLEHGVFPASPTKTKTGLAIDLLDLYRTLFERSCDAITALQLHFIRCTSGGVSGFYQGRYVFKLLIFTFLSILYLQKASEDEHVSDPYRRLLIQAVQWATNLRDRVERKVAAVLTWAESSLSQAPEATTEAVEPTSTMTSVDPVMTVEPTSMTSATAFVDPVATFVASAATEDAGSGAPPDCDMPPPDAPRPSPTSGPSPQLKPGRTNRILCERCPACFNLEEWGQPLVNEGGDVQFGADGCFSYHHLRKAGDGPISYDPSLFIPKHKVDVVGKRLDAVRDHLAAKAKPSMPQEVIDTCQESWDAANEKKWKVDPKRYDASGIFVMTCRHRQVIFLCNVDTPGEQQRSIVAMLGEVFTLLPPHATVLQAYDVGCVTEHSLNLHPIFPPAIRIGLADHESVERFWSRIRKLIPLTRGQWNSRRIWMIDQYANFRKNMTPKHRAALKTLQECRIPVQELRAEWAAQKAAQTSIRAHAPARLRRELGKVLLLQNQIDAVEKAITDTKKTLHSSTSPRKKAEELYTSLNIQKDFPELRDLPLEFAQTLLMMRDLKINIRKRAIGSFFEWESLDRAVSGRREALGTKLHQSTRKAISRRQPSLLKAIKKFNTGCETLERLRPPQCNIPIPSPLSVQLNGVRNNPSLHEDDGIRSLHAADRCAEEAVRLNMERNNLRRWLLEEREVVRRAIEMERDSSLTFLLRLRKDTLTDLERSWAPCLWLQDVDSCFVTESASSATTFTTSATTFATSMTTFTTSTTTFATSVATFAPSTATSAPIPTSIAASSSSVSPAEAEEAEEIVDVDGDGYELDPGAISDEDQANLIEEVLHDSDDDEDETETSAVEASTDCLDVRWDYTPSDDIDVSFIPDLATRNASLQVITGDFSHFVVCPGLRPLEITPCDLAPFFRRNGRLTGFGLNGVAASLQTLFSGPFSPTKISTNQCAVFSTYDLPCARYKGSGPDLWPQEEHWVLVVVVVPTQELFFFDSMASRRGWRQDLRDVMILISDWLRCRVAINTHCTYPQKTQAKGGLHTHSSPWAIHGRPMA
ncbi:hypothetical protein B0H13DRAFT_2561464 [Mycena leptocephala]|nr:hypothetical protein B0H13DRAFT_2561464 [Mycena leptocephala]